MQQSAKSNIAKQQSKNLSVLMSVNNRFDLYFFIEVCTFLKKYLEILKY